LEYVYAFIVGGLICTVGQVLLIKTNLNSARILVIFVSAGVIFTMFGLYQPLVDLGGSGATVPLSGFGYALAKGAMEAAKQEGIAGAITGGLSATAAGISAAVLFGYLAAVIFDPKSKK
jgi:stage V sporulation protein AE